MEREGEQKFSLEEIFVAQGMSLSLLFTKCTSLSLMAA
jgi:hypothetical protein